MGLFLAPFFEYAFKTRHTAGVTRFRVSETAIAKAIEPQHNILGNLLRRAISYVEGAAFSLVETNALISTRLKTAPLNAMFH